MWPDGNEFNAVPWLTNHMGLRKGTVMQLIL